MHDWLRETAMRLFLCCALPALCINVEESGAVQRHILLDADVVTLMLKQRADALQLPINVMRFDDYIPNLLPVVIFDSLQNVQLTLLYVYLEQVHAFNTVFSDNLRDGPELTKKCFTLDSFAC